MKLRHHTDDAKGLRRPRTRLTLGAVAVLAAATAFAGPGRAAAQTTSDAPPVDVTVLTPGRNCTAGAGGVFNVDISLSARHDDDGPLSAAKGYKPFLNTPGSPTFGPGQPDPGAPGLVVLLSTTPRAAGGPNANLAGVFQLTAVHRVRVLDKTYSAWKARS